MNENSKCEMCHFMQHFISNGEPEKLFIHQLHFIEAFEETFLSLLLGATMFYVYIQQSCISFDSEVGAKKKIIYFNNSTSPTTSLMLLIRWWFLLSVSEVFELLFIIIAFSVFSFFFLCCFLIKLVLVLDDSLMQ